MTSFCLDNEDNGPRKRKNSASHQGEEKDIKWSRRLKRPRMHMVADEIESKMSAKTRLYKGIQRRIDRPDVRKDFGSDQIEIYEEEEEENEMLHRPDQSRRKSEPIMGDKTETLTMSVKIQNSNSITVRSITESAIMYDTVSLLGKGNSDFYGCILL